jgi:chromatin structure-remodeling complex subunit RSC9
MLVAADFIKNVSATFKRASAQVINGPSPRFIIKGIRPRRIAVDLDGREFSRCLWQGPEAKEPCGAYCQGPEGIWQHIVMEHIGLSKGQDGKWDLDAKPPEEGDTDGRRDIGCYWAGCRHFSDPGRPPTAFEVGMHVKTHMPGKSQSRPKGALGDASEGTSSNEQADQEEKAAVYHYHTWHDTVVDERGDAAGLPLTSVLILRNIARNVPKAWLGIASEAGTRPGPRSRKEWMTDLFGPFEQRLWCVMTFNRPLAGHVWNLMNTIQRAMEA